MNEIERSSKAPGLRGFSMVELLIALGLLFFAVPFVEKLKHGEVIVSALISLVLVSAVLAVASRPRTLAIAITLAIPALAGRWLNHAYPQLVPPEIFLVAGIALIGFVVFNLLQFILRVSAVDGEVLCASVSAYLMLGLIWAMAYWLVDELIPGAFSFNTPANANDTIESSNAFYFSFITLCTVGYGDITPVSRVARMLAALEAVTGLLYVAILIARLVGLNSAPKSSSP
jgi:hypothetical protein